MFEGNELLKLLNIKFPIIMAPMFLVTNERMMVEASNSGIAACIPALNYRTTGLLKEGILRIREQTDGVIGVNLIVNRSNIYYKDQLKVVKNSGANFVITSLGNPKETIENCKPKGVKVFCDVVDLEFALKVESLGADAIIAVNSKAGGHAGKIEAEDLIPLLIKECKIPIISAGGVGTGEGIKEIMELGACGVSIGTPFIATVECGVSNDYKNAIVDYKGSDIVFTEKLSGTPCTIIKTPYVEKIGTKIGVIEKFLIKNRVFKKYYKMFRFYKGAKLLQDSAFKATYKTFWCAGPSLEYVKEITNLSKLVKRLIDEYSVKDL